LNWSLQHTTISLKTTYINFFRQTYIHVMFMCSFGYETFTVLTLL
jgi:hypothetical protein